jgi:hypothetical protein
MTRPLPELLNGGEWQTKTPSHSPHEPSANPARRTITAHTNGDHTPDERQSRDHLTALVGSKYNSRRPGILAHNLISGARYPMTNEEHATRLAAARQLFHTAEETRNRLLANHTPTGKHTEPQRYLLPEQIARHHADPKTRRNLAQDLAALIHHPQDLATYLATLGKLSPELAELAERTALRVDRATHQLLQELQTPKGRQSRAAAFWQPQRGETETTETHKVLRVKPAELTALNIARQLAEYQNAATDRRNRDRRNAAKKRAAQKKLRGNAHPDDADDLQGWYAVVPNKPPREVAHLGRLGRKRTLADTGKTPNRIANYCGDPLRRIYTRKTRGTNALVIVDCSGSMSLDTDDLDAILKACHGATVIAYSADDDSTPNTHLLAHNSRRVRDMPHFPGNNGNDAPAASWAIKHYRKHNAPVLWITDGRATGRGDQGNPELRAQCQRLAKRHGITIARTVPEALRDLAQLAAGKKPEQRLYTFR